MAETVTLELPDDLAHRARAEATQTSRRVEEVLVDWLQRADPEIPVESLPDDQVLALCNGQLPPDQQEELSELLDLNREGALEGENSRRFEHLMHAYRQGLVRKARAVKEAVTRGLKPRLN